MTKTSPTASVLNGSLMMKSNVGHIGLGTAAIAVGNANSA